MLLLWILTSGVAIITPFLCNKAVNSCRGGPEPALSAAEGWPSWAPTQRCPYIYGLYRRSWYNIASAILNPSWSPDGTSPTRLTNNPAFDGSPSWSPDGSKISFKSTRDGNPEIYVMNADGSGQTRLTNNPALDYEPAWSPDSSKIVFKTDRDGNYEIYVMNADGTNQTRLTNNPAVDGEPAWGRGP